MKAMHSAPPEKAWKLGKGPFIFSGFPPHCAGNLEIINISDEKVKIKAIPAFKNEDPVYEHFKEVRVAVSLEPRTHVRVPAFFDIQPDTPSGTYRTSLSCGKQQVEAIIHVFDKYSYILSPPRIFLRGSAGETLTHPLIITNTGNVSFSLPEVGLIWFEEQDWVGRTFVYALRESPKGGGYENYLDRVMGEFQSEMIPSTRIHVECKPWEINSGVVAQASLTVTIPKEFKKGRTYLGFIKIPGRRLWFEVECIGSINSEKRRQK